MDVGYGWYGVVGCELVFGFWVGVDAFNTCAATVVVEVSMQSSVQALRFDPTVPDIRLSNTI